jgi:GLTT repeat (6 copies)
MARVDTALDWLAKRVVRHVTCPADPSKTPTHSDVAQLRRTLRPGDVLLIDGCDHVSSAIRYFTQSSWSHAALFVGEALTAPGLTAPGLTAPGLTAPGLTVPGLTAPGSVGQRHDLVEMNLGEGCVSIPLEKYRLYPTRICRPAGISDADRSAVVAFMIERIGFAYDTRNVLDLARFMMPAFPLPRHLRRRALSLGSGAPTRAICSTLIAQAFQSVGYPILPRVERAGPLAGLDGYSADEIFHIRHHSLFAPRDFDLSPYFEVVKPVLADGFDYKRFAWAKPTDMPASGDHPPLQRPTCPTPMENIT